MTTVASNDKPSPREASKMYFQAASTALSVPSRATSNALTTVVTSIATHSSPMLLTKGAIAIAHANMFMPANKRRR